MIKIIGIDPGLAATGIGVVKGEGLKVFGYSFDSITTSSKIPLAERLYKIFSHLLLVLDEEKPDLMIVEDVFFLQRNPKSGITLGQVSGVVHLAGCHAEVPVIAIPVREAKQVLTGNGNASKMQLETAVRHVLHIEKPIKPYHVSDAMALALIGLFRHQKNMLKPVTSRS